LLLQNGYPTGVINYNINDVLNRQQNRTKNPSTTVPKKEIILVLLYLGEQSKIVTKQLKTCVDKFYGCINLRVIFQSAYRIKSLFPYKDRINRCSVVTEVVFNLTFCLTKMITAYSKKIGQFFETVKVLVLESAGSSCQPHLSN